MYSEEAKMQKRVLTFTTSAFILACGAFTASAQQGAMMQHQSQVPAPATRAGDPGGMHSGMMMRVLFAMMDSDGDGTVSLQEFQAAHERIFKAMDINKDGVLTLEEIQSFMHGARTPIPGEQPARRPRTSD
jgi:hypothetical protein